MGAAPRPPARGEGHLPTLVASLLHFCVTSMLWVLLGALGIYIVEEAGLSPVEKALVVAVPILSGSLLRVPLGLLGDWIGTKRVAVAMLACTLLPLWTGWQASGSFSGLLITGLLLGIAGASFAVALPLASQWYPRERQGLVLGVVGAGNCGTVLTYLLAPRLAESLGWHAVMALGVIPLALVAALFLLWAKDLPPTGPRRSPGEYLVVLRDGDLWLLGTLYAVTFGGYMGLGSFLPVLLRDQYATSPIAAGSIAALAALAGGAVRPLGGYLADRVGGARVLSVVLPALAILYALVARLPSLPAAQGLVFTAMLCMGIGNGAVFQLVPGRFPRQVGVATGVVGALGGLGGFFLPVLLGSLRAGQGTFASGFGVLAAITAAAALAQLFIETTRRAARPAPSPALSAHPNLAGLPGGPTVEPN